MDVKTKLRQARAAYVAEFAFKQRLERIAWEESFLMPEMKRLERNAGADLEIPEFIIHDDYEDNQDYNPT